MAWPLLSFPNDFLSFFLTRKAFMGAIGLIMALTALALAFPHQRFARRLVAAASDRQAFYFTLTWFVIAYLAFILLTPAASFVNTGLMLVLAAPGYLLFALARRRRRQNDDAPVRSRRRATRRPRVLWRPRSNNVQQSTPRHEPTGIETFLDVASRWTLEAGTKIYAWPDENLLLTYVSGLPVQSVAPVRKAFLDQYPGDVIFVETGTAYAGRR